MYFVQKLEKIIQISWKKWFEKGFFFLNETFREVSWKLYCVFLTKPIIDIYIRIYKNPQEVWFQQFVKLLLAFLFCHTLSFSNKRPLAPEKPIFNIHRLFSFSPLLSRPRIEFLYHCWICIKLHGYLAPDFLFFSWWEREG